MLRLKSSLQPPFSPRPLFFSYLHRLSSSASSVSPTFVTGRHHQHGRRQCLWMGSIYFCFRRFKRGIVSLSPHFAIHNVVFYYPLGVQSFIAVAGQANKLSSKTTLEITRLQSFTVEHSVFHGGNYYSAALVGAESMGNMVIF